MNRKITLVGAGNLATHLGRALRENGHEIVEVYSRTTDSARNLASQLDCQPVTSVEALQNHEGLYIVALKDAVLHEIIPVLCQGRQQATFVHTAGSIPMNIFAPFAQHYGVFYPMQTFSKNKKVHFADIPCFIEANDTQSQLLLQTLAQSVSNHVSYCDTAQRRHLHLAAVFACNFVNHCYDIAATILQEQGLPFQALLPLIDETANKVHHLHPHNAQTGPAVRYDTNVIQAQAQLLEKHPSFRNVYLAMSQHIHKQFCHD